MHEKPPTINIENLFILQPQPRSDRDHRLRPPRRQGGPLNARRRADALEKTDQARDLLNRAACDLPDGRSRDFVVTAADAADAAYFAQEEEDRSAWEAEEVVGA